MPAVNLSPIFNAVASTDDNGNPLALGKIYSYQAGSTTPYATYQDALGTIPNTNPIVLGVDGKINGLLWLEENIAYKFVLQDASNVQIATYDNISGVVTALPAIELLPTGVIVIWSGAIGSVPAGWGLCDGQNGRPDLRDKFIVGAGNLYPPSTTGGSDTIIPQGTIVATVQPHALTEGEMPRHYHQMRGPNNISAPQNDQGASYNWGNYGGGTADDAAQQYGTYSTGQGATSGGTVIGANAGDPHAHNITANFTGTSQTNLPSYYALAYIIKN